MGLELEKEKQARAALEDPTALEKRIQTRLTLVEKCRSLLGQDCKLEGKSDVDLKLDVIGKFYPDQTLPKEDHSYVEGMFNAICGMQTSRNDSLTSTRQAIHHQDNSIAANAYEKWLEQSAKLWSVPLTGSLRS